jgi:hypothetical protein
MVYEKLQQKNFQQNSMAIDLQQKKTPAKVYGPIELTLRFVKQSKKCIFKKPYYGK